MALTVGEKKNQSSIPYIASRGIASVANDSTAALTSFTALPTKDRVDLGQGHPTGSGSPDEISPHGREEKGEKEEGEEGDGEEDGEEDG